MRTTIQTILFLSTIILVPSSVHSQSELKISTTIRPRMEFRDGYKTLKKEGDIPAAFVSQRSRLRVDFKNELVQTRFTIYDYRVWGDQMWKKDIPTAGIHEAWASVKLGEYTRLKIGRQSFQYDNGRLLSAVNWNQVGAAHDGAMLSYLKNDFNLEIFTAWNQNKENISGTDYMYDGLTASFYYKNLNILWLSKKFNKAQLSFLTLVDGHEEVKEIEGEEINNPDHLNYRYTSGLIYKQTLGDIKFKAQGFFQGGKLYTGEDVSAYYLNCEVNYKINSNAGIQLGFETFSGNDYSDTDNTTNKAFDILLGARHKFNGRIDYFSTPSTTKQVGLVNPFAKLDYSFKNKTSVKLAYHQFFLHQSYLPDNITQSVDKYLGQEIDLTVKKKFNEYMSIQGGYSIMLASNTMELLKGGDKTKLNQWAFVMFTINPTLFTHKNE